MKFIFNLKKNGKNQKIKSCIEYGIITKQYDMVRYLITFNHLIYFMNKYFIKCDKNFYKQDTERCYL